MKTVVIHSLFLISLLFAQANRPLGEQNMMEVTNQGRGTREYFLDSIKHEIKKGSRIKLHLEDTIITTGYHGIKLDKGIFIGSNKYEIPVDAVREFSFINDTKSKKHILIIAPIIGGLVGLGVERAIHKNRDDENVVRRSRGISFDENETSQIDFFEDLRSPLLAFTGGAIAGLASGLIIFDVKNRETVSLSVAIPLGGASK